MKTTLLVAPVAIALLGGPARAQQPPDAFKKLEAEFNKASREWRSKDIAARRGGADADELKAIQAADPYHRYAPRFRAGAERHVGTGRAVPYLQWVFGWANRRGTEGAYEALDQLVNHHVEHPSMQKFAFSIALMARRYGFDRERTLATQQQIADAAKDPQSRAETLYWRAYVVGGTQSTVAEKKRALADLATAIENGDARTKQRAKGLRFELAQLQLGMVAPDIEGEDLDGVAFKLSDYRGKVVLLDFWGDW